MNDPQAGSGHAVEVERLLGETTWLRRLASRLVGEADADDLCQDVAVAALAQPPSQRAGLGAWLVGVMRNLAAERRRAGARRTVREQVAARAEAVPSASDLVASVQLQRRVVDAVLALAEPYRSAVLLRFWENLPPARIAAAAGVPVDTVRTRIKRGLAMVRVRLDDECGERRVWAVPLGVFAAGRSMVVAAAGGTLAGAIVVTQVKIAVGVALALLLALGTWWLQPSRQVVGDDTAAPAQPSAPLVATASIPPSAAPRQAVDAGAVASDAPVRLAITGVLIDELTLTPIADGEVWLRRAVARATPAREVEVRSAADGTFVLTTADAQLASAPELWIRVADRATLRPTLPRAVVATGQVDLGRVLVPPGTGVRGLVVDVRGLPVAGAQVFAATSAYLGDPREPATALLRDLLPLARTDAAGQFRAEERILPYGSEVFALAVGPRSVGCARIAVTRARQDLEVTVRLCATTKLAVAVRDAAGRAVANARVSAVPRFSPLGGPTVLAEGVHPAARHLFDATTDAAGRALLATLPVGDANDGSDGREYDVAVHADEQRPVLRIARLDPLRTVELAVELGPNQLTRVHGRVSDDAGQPIAGAEVRVAELAASTDVRGDYELRAVPLRQHLLALSVTAPGHQPVHQQVKVPTAKEARFDFTLTRTRRVWGRAVDQFGVPVVAARVFVGHAHLGTTGVDGGFDVVGSAGNDVELVVMPPDPLDGWGPVFPRPLHACSFPIEWQLERRAPGLANLRIEVVDALTGAPADADGALFAVDAADQRIGNPLTAAETRIGLRRYVGLRPQRYLVTVGPRYQRVVTVAPNDVDLTVRAELRPAGSIRGELLLDHLPPAQWPANVMLTIAPTQESARWLAPHGGRLFGSPDRPTGIELAPAVERRFALEDVDPYVAVQITAQAPGLLAVAPVQLPPHGPAEVKLRLQAAGRLELSLSTPLPAGFVTLSWRERHGDRFERSVALPLTPDRRGHPRASLAMLPGSYRWQVRWRVQGTDDYRACEGDVDVAAGVASAVQVDVAAGLLVK